MTFAIVAIIAFAVGGILGYGAGYASAAEEEKAFADPEAFMTATDRAKITFGVSL